MAVALSIATPTAAQTRRPILEEIQRLHALLLQEETERHAESRRRERDAVAEMEELAGDLDRALDAPEAAVTELRALEQQLADGREIAFARARESAALRRDIYRRMELLGEITARLETLLSPATELLTGRWRFESTTRPTRTSAAPVPPRPDATGVFQLEQQGAVVTGSYRLDGGAEGFLQGTFAGDRLDLMRIDAVRGEDMILEGAFDPETGQLAGTWSSRELAAGRPAAGEWAASRVGEEP
jgi:hypothetical protein